MRTSDQIQDLVAALATARPSFGGIDRTKKAYQYRYAPLEDVLDAIVGPLSVNGLVLIGTIEHLPDLGVSVISRLVHTSGQWIECIVPLPPYKTAQELGSGVTYIRRYSYLTLVGVQPQDEDDDGEASSQAKSQPVRRSEPPSQEPATESIQHPSADDVSTLVELALSAGADMAAFGRDMRRMMALSDETKITKKFLRETMTIKQYREANLYYNQKLGERMAEDVPNFPPPNPPVSESVDDGTIEAAEVQGETVEAEPPSNDQPPAPESGYYVSPTEIQALRMLAKEVDKLSGEDKSDRDVLAAEQHHEHGFRRTLYIEMKQRLLKRLEALRASEPNLAS